MINIDTNILVRALVGDDPRQSVIARRFLTEECSVDQPGFISTIVLAETCWVLEDAYRYGPEAVRGAVSALLETPELVVENTPAVTGALQIEASSKIGFVDRLITAIGIQAGCDETVTFDRALGNLPHTRVLRE